MRRLDLNTGVVRAGRGVELPSSSPSVHPLAVATAATDLTNGSAELPLNITLSFQTALSQPRMDYKVIDRIGVCRFVHGLQHSEKTTISEGIHLPTGVKVRMKTVRGQNMADYERGQELSREATVLARLSHPNIIHVYHLVKHADIRTLVTEWIDGLSLENFIRLFFHRRLPESIARLYCRQMVSAIIAMQQKHILLREIPVKSLMITRDFRCIKFTDFSSALCLPLRKGVTSATCSPEFTAPELIQENLEVVGPEAVSWPLGVVLFYMLVGELPFQSPYYDHKRRERLLRFALRGLSSNHTTAISSFTPACQLLLRQLLEPRAIIRIPICELCTNAWITDSGSQPFQPFLPCSAHIIASLESASKLTPSTSYRESAVNSNHQQAGKWEAPVNNRGLVSRVKDMFARNEEDKSAANTRGNEWLLATDVEANDTNMRSDSTDTNAAFGEKKCNNTTEALDYLARLRKTSPSEIARAITERPIGEISATFQILLNLHRQNAGVYLVDHTTPGWPQLESASFMAFMDSTIMKRLRVSSRDVGNFDSYTSKSALRSINWWWCPILLRNLGSCCCSGGDEVFIGSQLDRKAFRRALMVSIEAFERKMLSQTPSQSKTEATPSLISCKTLDSRRPKQMKSKHSINAFGVVVIRKTNQLQTPEDSSRLVREFTERLRRSSMRASVRSNFRNA
ncbi:Maternal embryonic leucine zipper kinase [Taenia crassiceps]|uniref:Maternal embryonic leucine zipper kinase n=1 Tax=Taenia crassiceps TaxID=6207 RepID=A0ABR4Q151_9CEST